MKMRTAIQPLNKTSLGFTWVELLLVIAVLSILATIAIPKIYNYTNLAKTTATESILGTTRTSISTFVLNSIADTGSSLFPTHTQMTNGNVLDDTMLPNPYTGDNAIRDASGTWEEGEIPISGPEGWAYDDVVGKFWANSDVNGEHLL